LARTMMNLPTLKYLFACVTNVFAVSPIVFDDVDVPNSFAACAALSTALACAFVALVAAFVALVAACDALLDDAVAFAFVVLTAAVASKTSVHFAASVANAGLDRWLSIHR